MLSQEFRQNRPRFPIEELKKYRGQWVAFSADGLRIVAGTPTLEELHNLLDAAGEDTQQLWFEGVPGPDDDIFLGAGGDVLMLRFSYQEELLTGPSPPSLPAGATVRWRPLVPVVVFGPTGLRERFARAVVDTGADDTVFPLDVARRIGAVLRPDTGHRVRWRGQLHSLRFGDVELVLEDDTGTWRWPAIVTFSPAPMPYPLLGTAGCLQFMDAHFRGADLIVELETNHTFPGAIA